MGTLSPLIDEDYSGCSHYKRKCKLVAPCCDQIFSCRFCHDDAVTGHVIDRRKVVQVVCGRCSFRQDVGPKCIQETCDTVFGSAYFCSTCKLFDDEDKGQFHCDGCGICRIGGRDNFVHCDTCGLCLRRDQEHKCIRDTSHNNCPVCMEDIHNSRDPAHVPPCSHLLHQKCYSEMLKKGMYACPMCGLAMQNMSDVWARLDSEIAITPMPREYAELYRGILCKDCNKKSTAKFHIVGMKCGIDTCGSYNTTEDGGFLKKDGETFRPVTDAELQELSNVATSVNNHNNENIPELTDSDDSRSDSDEDDGWETTEDDDEDDKDNNH